MVLIAFVLLVLAQDPTNKPRTIDPVKFDEWHDLRFGDEKARLDNVSIAWKNLNGRSQHTIYLVIYAGQRACVGEARARGIRAKSYLVKRNVPAENIIWIEAGWRDEVTTQVWICPSGVGPPAVFAEPDSVSPPKIEKGCRIKYRGGRK